MMSNNHCGCSIESTCATVAGGVLTITVIPLQSYYDYRHYAFDLCLSLPAHIGTEPVALSDGAGAYPLMDTNGQPVVSGQLRGHRRYRVQYGAGGALSSGTVPAHFTVCEGLRCLEYSANAAL